MENCPVDEAGIRESRAWLIALPLSEAANGQQIRDLSIAYAQWFSEQIVQLLDRIGVSRTAVDQLVVTVYGITVAAVENPEGWPRERIESLIDRTLASVGITTPAGA
ncbi:hypothetical protein [Nocardia sp. NBC_01009]|uniref:hypothetical protein n=1 Tax=Nocardia sp. NBC_01009 TaxID=2975996 RepID=UPI00386E58F2|nr:TetR family transcriptional regulator C-terminal domain-containing protein [Nocardia sp. NBC_01009]